MLLEFRDGNRRSIIGEREIIPHQVRDGLSLLVGDIDMDEFQNNGHVILKRLREYLLLDLSS